MGGRWLDIAGPVGFLGHLCMSEDMCLCMKRAQLEWFVPCFSSIIQRSGGHDAWLIRTRGFRVAVQVLGPGINFYSIPCMGWGMITGVKLCC